jgi:hypothetical protein
LRGQWRKPWEFESPRRHHLQVSEVRNQVSVKLLTAHGVADP